MEQETLIKEDSPEVKTTTDKAPTKQPKKDAADIPTAETPEISGSVPADKVQDLTLAEKLVHIERDMPAIQKTGKNLDDRGNVRYEFVEQQTIMNTVRPLLMHYGVLVVPRVLDHKLVNRSGYSEKAGSEVSRGVKAVVSMTFTFVNVHNREDTLEISWYAEGDDFGDKGTNKATTIAQKNMYIRLFNIADQDPDATTPEAAGVATPTKVVTNDKITIINTMLRRLKISPADFEEKQKKTIEKMTNAEADDAISRMEAVISRQLAEEAAGVKANA